MLTKCFAPEMLYESTPWNGGHAARSPRLLLRTFPRIRTVSPRTLAKPVDLGPMAAFDRGLYEVLITEALARLSSPNRFPNPRRSLAAPARRAARRHRRLGRSISSPARGEAETRAADPDVDTKSGLFRLRLTLANFKRPWGSEGAARSNNSAEAANAHWRMLRRLTERRRINQELMMSTSGADSIVQKSLCAD